MVHTARLLHPTPPATRGWGQGILSVLLGTGFTLGLFVGIARFDHADATEPPVEIADLRAVTLEAPPPPPPQEVVREPVALEATLSGIETAPSDSPVQLTITPPDLEGLLPPPSIAPPAVIQVGQLYANLKPRMELALPGDHVFQMAEVDKLPEVLHRVMPHIPSALLSRIKTPRVTLMFVVDAKGELQNVRVIGSCGDAEVDEVVRKVIFEWSFAPAMRKGVKVRCLLQQAMIIKISGRSLFEL